MSDTIQQKLDRLANLKYHVDVINLEYNAMREKVLTPEILAMLNDIEAERKTALESVNAGIASLESEVRQEVIAYGQTVKGLLMKATFVKGAERWNSQELNAYAKLHPEINVYKKTGEPQVRLELIK